MPWTNQFNNMRYFFLAAWDDYNISTKRSPQPFDKLTSDTAKSTTELSNSDENVDAMHGHVHGMSVFFLGLDNETTMLCGQRRYVILVSLTLRNDASQLLPISSAKTSKLFNTIIRSNFLVAITFALAACEGCGSSTEFHKADWFGVCSFQVFSTDWIRYGPYCLRIYCLERLN